MKANEMLKKAGELISKNKGTILKCCAAAIVVILQSRFKLNGTYNLDSSRECSLLEDIDFMSGSGSVETDKIWALYKSLSDCSWDSDRLSIARKIYTIANDSASDETKRAAVRALKMISPKMDWGSGKTSISDLIMRIK